jgi:hypothetical protein
MKKEIEMTLDQLIVQLVNYEAQHVALLQAQEDVEVPHQNPQIEAEHFYDLDAVHYGLM